MGDDLSILRDRISALLDRGENGSSSADEVEHTLTDGYARALALEGERKRTEARMRDLSGSPEHVNDLRSLKDRLHAIEADLSELRDLLSVLAATR